MIKLFCIACLLLVNFSQIRANDNVNCTAVNLNPENFPLSFVNLCTDDQTDEDNHSTMMSRMTSKMRSFDTCPPFKCEETCLFGFKNDKFGCSLCECVEEGKEGVFEGDISVVGDMRIYMNANLEGGKGVKQSRGATRTLPLWKMYKSGSNYIVPYVVSSSIGSSGRRAIEAAKADFQKYSCIRLQPRSNQNRYINFYRGGGCSSPVGAVATRQDVSLATGCWYKGTVIHEVLHSLGFWHEQSRPDRDNHVRINYQNISPSVRYNFNKFSTSQVDSRGSPYDVGSIMHYNGYDFSSNGGATITDLRGNAIRAQRNGFSTEDLKQLNALYPCSTTGGGGTGTGTGTGGSCTDSNENCGYWASAGECTKNPGWMLENCKKSCDNCKGTSTNCKDENDSCSGWSGYGYCKGRYETYMGKYCKKSCKLC